MDKDTSSAEFSLFESARRKSSKPKLNHGTSPSFNDGFDGLFPKIKMGNSNRNMLDDHSTYNEIIDDQTTSSYKRNRILRNKTSHTGTDPFAQWSSEGDRVSSTKKIKSNGTGTIDLGTGEVSPAPDDVRSSVINMMLNDKEIANNMGTTNKLLYSQTYSKYATDGYDLTRQQSQTDITDFEKYNRALMKEELIKAKVEQELQKRMPPANGNALLRLDEADLNDGYLDMGPVQGTSSNQGGNIVSRLMTPFSRGIKKGKRKNKIPGYYHETHSNSINPFSSNTETTVNESDSTKTRQIDEQVDLDDLPIDMQLQGNRKKKLQRQPQQKQNNVDQKHYGFFDKLQPHYSRPHNTSTGGYYTPASSDDMTPEDIEMIVSNQENLDYNFHRIDKDEYSENEAQRPNGMDTRYTYGPGLQDGSSTTRHKLQFNIPFFSFTNFKIDQRNQIQRKLTVRHLHQIALGGTLGVGLLLSSGKAFTIAGPLGCLLGFIIAGLIVLATMVSFCEMVTLIPLCGGVSGVSSRFVDDAFGFALGVSYWISYTISMPTEIVAASIMLSYYPNLHIPGGSTAGWITLFLGITILINLFDIRVYGEFEYFSTLIKVLVLIILMVYMIVLNTGGVAPFHVHIGFRYWDSKKSESLDYITYGAFRPTYDVTDPGFGSTNGIGGAKGRLCQVIIASMVAAFAYVGTEIVILAGSESRNPRDSIPRATRSIYWRILIFYVLATFLVGLNIYAGDPRLLRFFSFSDISKYHLTSAEASAMQKEIIERSAGPLHCKTNMLEYAGFSNGNQSPFVIALQSAGACQFSSAVNAFMLFFALTAASSQLYASSRTLYFLAVQGKAPKIFRSCSKSGVPYMSVLFTGLIGCSSYLAVHNNTAYVFERMLSVCATTGLIVWGGMCLAFIRFYYGLKLRPDIIGRDDENYPYRSPFQPFTAYFGMISSPLLVIVAGFVVYLDAPFSWAQFITSYGSLMMFFLCYFGYKVFRRTRVHRLDQLDLDSGRREIDRIIWEDEKNYVSNFKEIIAKGWSFLF
ncbi:unnamed protein product [Ambrosiozyma monospora]|uniref:Unnamed protein product n=1 Tax=Ambrosiozyma monospora TaxID=43982 RepID=A0A9W7DG30_AMBMO|nr:unnamed protein product [Ambrosiozyma monospora]